MKNMRLGSAGNPTVISGGMITTQTGTNLILNNVDILKAAIPYGSCAGITCTGGSLDLTNVRFAECLSERYGSCITTYSGATATLEGCQFINNVGNLTSTAASPGAACIKVNQGGINSELLLNNCYFSGNVFGYFANTIAIGGFTLNKMKLHVTNSTFANNVGTGAGSIFIETSITNPREIDLLVENCTFLKNTLSTGTNGTVYQMNGAASGNITGTISFINNTMYRNQRLSGGSYGIYFQDMSVTFNYINNLSLYAGTNYDVQFITNADPTKHCTPTIKGNDYQHVGSGVAGTLLYMLKDAAYNHLNTGIASVKMDTVLTDPGNNKAPYLPLQSGSDAIDIGFDDGVLVPALDVRGQAIFGVKKDAGAYEYVVPTGFKDAGKVASISASLNPLTHILTFSQELAKVEIFNVTGARVLALVNKVSQIDATALEAGLYLVRVTTMDGAVSTIKMQK